MTSPIRTLGHLLFLASLVCLGINSKAQITCGCDSTSTVQDHIQAANVIVLGTCVKVTTNPIKGGLNIVFQVDSSWKRATEAYTTIYSNSPGQCGFPFKEGHTYLVFGQKRHQTIRTSLCQPNVRLDQGGYQLISQLGIGFAPGRPELARNMNLLILGMGLAALLLMALVVLRKQLFRSKP